MNYKKFKEPRWNLAEMLIKIHSFLIVPLYSWDYLDEAKRGKVPWVKWKDKQSTSLEELQKWRKRYNGDSNIGLCLGLRSGNGLLAIDSDGAEGRAMLDEMSGGDLPPTVMYTTPGGDGQGLRYLYLYPAEYQGQILRKQFKSGKGEHSEVAILAEGQQTVLPYSIHPNGKPYLFVKGHSFDDIEIGIAPSWMMEMLLKKNHAPSPTPTSRTFLMPANPLQTVSKPIVEELIAQSNCKKLIDLLQRQKSEESLPEQEWFNTVSLLTRSVGAEAAMEFSGFSNKHNERSVERINALALEESKGTKRCTTLGCVEGEVAQCFKKVRRDGNGNIKNSPAVKLRQKVEEDKQDLSEAILAADTGLYYDKEGKFMGLNANIFVRYAVCKSDLRIVEGFRPEDSRYFFYKPEHYWQEIGSLQVKRFLFDSLNECEKDVWSPSIGRRLLEVLPLECRNTIDLTNTHQFINVENGLLNLETLKLEPHSKDIISTNQLPLVYDEDAEAPEFIQFLSDVFEDQDTLSLIQEIFGYALSPSIDARKFFCLIGDGANAKSVLMKILSSLAGENNISRISLRRFNERFSLAAIVGKRLIIATENETAKSVDTETIKAITVGDPIVIERKFGDVFDYVPSIKMFFLLNSLPRFRDTSYAFRRRLIAIPFNRRFVEEPIANFEGKEDIHMVDKLLVELPGILAWSIKGWKRLKENNFRFTVSKEVEACIKEFLVEANPLLDYFNQCIESDPGKRISPQDLYATVKDFYFTNGYKQDYAEVTTRSLPREFEAVLKNERVSFTRQKSNGVRYFKGVGLNYEGLQHLHDDRRHDYLR